MIRSNCARGEESLAVDDGVPPQRVQRDWSARGGLLRPGERSQQDQAARDRTIASAWSVRGLPRATVSMPVTWETLPDVTPEDFDVLTVPALLERDGDAHAGMDDAVGGIETALEWFAADERDRGLGELPYPPEYPKMPGEPMRVQPSRARAGKGTAG